MALTTYCCHALAEAIGFVCATMSAKGFKVDGVIINRNDVDFASITMHATYNNVMTNLPLAAGALGYAVSQPSVDPYKGSKVELVQGTYANTFTKTLHLVILMADHADGNIADKLACGEFVVVLRKKAANGATEYIVYGLDTGLKASEITQDYYSDDTNGGVEVTLVEEGAPVFGRYLDAGSESATETLLTAMITPSP